MSEGHDYADITRDIVSFYSALQVRIEPLVGPEAGEVGFEANVTRNRSYRPYGKVILRLEDLATEVVDQVN